MPKRSQPVGWTTPARYKADAVVRGERVYYSSTTLSPPELVEAADWVLEPGITSGLIEWYILQAGPYRRIGLKGLPVGLSDRQLIQIWARNVFMPLTLAGYMGTYLDGWLIPDIFTSFSQMLAVEWLKSGVGPAVEPDRLKDAIEAAERLKAVFA